MTRPSHRHKPKGKQATRAEFVPTEAHDSGVWLRMLPRGSEYLEPHYYERILKPYVFQGISDVGLLRQLIVRLPRTPLTILELGPGTGRATAELLERFSRDKYLGVDQSAGMVAFGTSRFRAHGARAKWICQDAVKFLLECDQTYDLVVSLWSISHAIHQSIARTGSSSEAQKAIGRLFRSCVKPRGRVFIIHFDSTSDEQRIAIAQRRRMWRFLQPGKPSPSQQLIESELRTLEKSGDWRISIERLEGDAIVYESLDRALESYMNFHMEGLFNQHAKRDLVLNGLKRALLARRGLDGHIRVIPGCVVFLAERM